MMGGKMMGGCWGDGAEKEKRRLTTDDGELILATNQPSPRGDGGKNGAEGA
jgi:hypothetical protein